MGDEERGKSEAQRSLCFPQGLAVILGWGLLIPGCGQGQPGVVGGVPWNGMDFEVPVPAQPIHPLWDIPDTTEPPSHWGTSTWMA